MRAHLRYLRYVLLHKAYVLRAGLLMGRSPRWLWRLLVHDWSKFTPAEWGPYVQQFYGPQTFDVQGDDEPVRRAETRFRELRAERQRAFQRAWLHHIHTNPHHWQHWILHEDSGKVLVLLPPGVVVDEMVADWIGAGSKILRGLSLADCVSETIVWYAANRDKMQMREAVRTIVEARLIQLADRFGIRAAAYEVQAAKAARASIIIPGR